MKVPLPISGKEAELRDFVPHKVMLAFNEAMYKGVEIKSSATSATKEELLQEFGAKAIKELDALSAAEFDKRFAELREEYLRRKMDVQGMSLGNVQEANLRKLEGMVISVDGQAATRQIIEDLPHEDAESLLEAIEGVSASTRAKKASAQHGS